MLAGLGWGFTDQRKLALQNCLCNVISVTNGGGYRRVSNFQKKALCDTLSVYLAGAIRSPKVWFWPCVYLPAATVVALSH